MIRTRPPRRRPAATRAGCRRSLRSVACQARVLPGRGAASERVRTTPPRSRSQPAAEECPQPAALDQPRRAPVSDRVLDRTHLPPLAPARRTRANHPVEWVNQTPGQVPHSCATILTALGMHPRVVTEMLGHSQISITMDTYAHVAPMLQREAADALEVALFG